jgi:asparagine synthase (glutamine-hydrolysing)
VCGLIGVVGSEDPQQTNKLDAALKLLTHRGPDASGRIDGPWLKLRHTRLTIIDLSASANQPLHSACGRYVLVFNGEIYNYQELYTRYLYGDPAVNKNSDTSVLLHLFMRFGKHCLTLLDGMFAFAICDLEARKLFLARDRFGEKPLYWISFGGIFAFASELRALRAALPELVCDIDTEACAIYHMVGSIPAPRTIYRNVSALLPGHWLNFRDGEIQIGRYWSLPAPVEQPNSQSYEETLALTRERLLDAVRSRMVSDVPVGLFLSGGFDSGSILSLLSSSGFKGIDAICLDFPETEFSEYELAKQTADKFDAILHRRVITAGEFVASLPAFFAAMDQPTSDGFNTFFVCRAARDLGIKVWLSGVGGDEIFGGYPSFTKLRTLSTLAKFLRVVPATLLESASSAVRRHPKLNRAVHLGDGGSPYVRAYQALRNSFPWRLARSVTSPVWDGEWCLPAVLDSMYPEPNPRADFFQMASLFETSVYMRSQLLRDIDNFSMVHSLELRAPFLSHKLFETVYLMEGRSKQSPEEAKPLLADALLSFLPADVQRQAKRGFTFPIERWLRSFIRGSFEEIAFDPALKDIWDQEAVRQLWAAHLKGRIHWGMMWQLYAFARWRLQTCAL